MVILRYETLDYKMTVVQYSHYTGLKVHLWKINRQTHRAISSIPYARSPLPHSKSGSLCHCSHRHGTASSPLSSILHKALQLTLPSSAGRCCFWRQKPMRRCRQAPCALKLKTGGERKKKKTLHNVWGEKMTSKGFTSPKLNPEPEGSTGAYVHHCAFV